MENQSAVQRLIEELFSCGLLHKDINRNNIIFRKAKKMESEQIKKVMLKAYGDGIDSKVYCADKIIQSIKQPKRD